MITVLLVDDHALVRRGFRRMLEDEADLQVIGEASDGREAIQLATELKPDVVVMDYSMPELDGVQATREIRLGSPESKIVILSMHSDENYQRNALAAGASGYVLKNALDVELATAIRDVAAGRPWGLDLKGKHDEGEELTPREKEILQLIALGKSNKEIAAMLGLSINTVSVHRNNLMHKMNVHRAAELVMYAIRKGLVSPP